MIGWWWLACHEEPQTSSPGPDTGSAIDTIAPPTADTASTTTDPRTPRSSCDVPGPCGADLAAAVWDDGPARGWLGYEIAEGVFDGQSLAMVGAPIGYGYGYSTLAVLDATDLSWIGSFEDDDPDGGSANSGFGGSIAFAPDGAHFAVGAMDGATGNNDDGVVFVFDRLPQGIELVDPVLELRGTLHWLLRFGSDVLYADLTGAGVDLVVGTGNAYEDRSNGIYRFDPSLTGHHGLEVASAVITGQAMFGQILAGWDGDRDGVSELVANFSEGVAHFDTPWLGDRTQEEADLLWTDSRPEHQLGSVLETLDDIDGDGHVDLALGSPTLWNPQERSGALYLVPSGHLVSSPADELPYQFLGIELGEGVGSAAASGDYNGDGFIDLAIGAYGVVPGAQAGKVLLYYGPLYPALRPSSDADYFVTGEHIYDWFGADVATVDADADSRDDLVIGAQGWHEGQGKVYLLPGSAFP